jgi:hypothetical protein
MNWVAMQALRSWFGTMASLYAAIILLLLFRKKVDNG